MTSFRKRRRKTTLTDKHGPLVLVGNGIDARYLFQDGTMLMLTPPMTYHPAETRSARRNGGLLFARVLHHELSRCVTQLEVALGDGSGDADAFRWPETWLGAITGKPPPDALTALAHLRRLAADAARRVELAESRRSAEDPPQPPLDFVLSSEVLEEHPPRPGVFFGRAEAVKAAMAADEAERQRHAATCTHCREHKHQVSGLRHP
jgi:hypothetical protein